MKISAQLHHSAQYQQATLTTNDIAKNLALPAKPDGTGFSANGGELLFLALATCFCNDLYREAKKTNLVIESVEVLVSGEFGSEGEAARGISYQVKVHAPQLTATQIAALVAQTDRLAEVHNTLREGIEVKLMAGG